MGLRKQVGVLSGGRGHYCGVPDLDFLIEQNKDPSSDYGYENYVSPEGAGWAGGWADG